MPPLHHPTTTSRRPLRFLLATALLVSSAAGAAPPGAAAPAPDAAAGVLAAMDRTADPCQDFYRYACGGWLAKTTLPGDETIWVRSFSEIHDQNRQRIRTLVERAAADPGDDPERRKVGALYGACMDEAAIEKAGARPLAAELARIDAVRDAKTLLGVAGELQAKGVASLFDMGSAPSYRDPTIAVAHWMQGGLGMPDRDYYVRTDEKSRALMKAYGEHVATMLGLLGESPTQARADAAAVVDFETALARASREATAMRDTATLDHPMDRAAFAKLAPGLDWEAYLAALGAPGIRGINVRTPEFFPALDALVHHTPPATLRAYLRWRLVDQRAGLLSRPFVDANFAFFGRTLGGQQELQPRWKRCVGAVQAMMPEAIGKLFVAEYFPGDSKQVALEMIHDIEGAFDADLAGLAWMDDATRERARGKMAAVVNKIGYPDRWKDYSAMAVRPNAPWYENAEAAVAWSVRDDLAKIDRPVDRNEWGMSPQTVNASYNPSRNAMTFPAGILQPPFFSRDFPPAMNYGAMGTVMGHELTHGFDDDGRKFDATGTLRDWWAPEVVARFEKQAACVADQYSGYEIEPGLKVNGRLTLGENIADNGGIKQSYAALQAWEARHGGSSPGLGDLTPDQLFFVAHAQAWCTQVSPEAARMRATVDVHSPSRWRVVGPIANHPAFAAAFSCPAGTPMNPVEKCTVW